MLIRDPKAGLCARYLKLALFLVRFLFEIQREREEKTDACREQRLKTERTHHLEQVVTHDPGHDEADGRIARAVTPA